MQELAHIFAAQVKRSDDSWHDVAWPRPEGGAEWRLDGELLRDNMRPLSDFMARHARELANFGGDTHRLLFHCKLAHARASWATICHQRRTRAATALPRELPAAKDPAAEATTPGHAVAQFATAPTPKEAVGPPQLAVPQRTPSVITRQLLEDAARDMMADAKRREVPGDCDRGVYASLYV
jgi:hypothetical protein